MNLLSKTVFALVFLSLTGHSLIFRAEGTKQLRPDSTYMGDLWIINGGGVYTCFATEQCGPDQKLYIHIAHAGEKVYMGFGSALFYLSFRIKLNGNAVYAKTINFSDGTPGYIKYHSQAVAGPNILNPHGYIPVTFSPAEPGDYSIEFLLPVPPGDPQIGMRLFDITVIDTTTTPFASINGRLWSKDWGFNTYDCNTATNASLATQYILTSDSIVTALSYNHMQGWNFDVTSTKNGCYPWPEPWDSSCMSRHGNHHYAQYKIFINDPDSSEYPTGNLGVIVGDSVSVTRGCDGKFTFTFSVNKPGTVKLNIESNLTPGIQPQDLTINHAVQKGTNTITWNGINALGEPVPCGDSVAVTLNYINGLTNVALFDVEKNLYGFIIELVRPAGAPIATYWNDTLLAAQGGQTQLTGCYAIPPDTGCHIWTGGAGYGLGSNNTVNTWWYAVSSLLDLGRFRVECVPHTPEGISGPLSLCTSSTATYTVDPDPLPGSEPDGYEWVLTEAGTGSMIFDSVDTGPSVTLHFSDFPPGQKRLMVRGHSDLCGLGQYGPGNTGILIDPVPSPQVTNAQKTFSICSGDTTDILLQSSMAGATFSYTAASTSPSITGQTGGVQNPIRQILFNTGNNLDSVIYRVVPFLSPCPGDTVAFIVSVLPADTLMLPIAVSSNPACEGTPVTFNMDSVVGGPLAVYDWTVNGIAAGTNAPAFSYVPLDGDQVGCTITSPAFCNPDQSATGMAVMMSVLPKLPVSVSLVSSPNPVCQGDSVSVTAIPVNGGSSPAYQWQVNGTAVGVNYYMYSYVPLNGDEVSCMLTTNMTCVVNSQAFDSVTVIVRPDLRVIDTTLCYGIPFLAGGSWQTSAGVYYDTVMPPVNCIHVVQTNLQYEPQISVSLGQDTIICGDPLTLDAFVPGASYLWQNGSMDSILVVTDPGEYDVTVTIGACSQSDSIAIGECPVKLWFPNTFTPNGDGLNDTFQPKGWGVERFSMQIFNRWGEMIYETNSLEPGWDGTSKGNPCPDDTYVYVSTYGGTTGLRMQSKGNIVLQRGSK